MIRTALLGDIDDLVALEADWWQLWHRCPVATPFQSPAWLVAWWRAFGPGRLATAAAWQDDTLVGLAPFFVEAVTRRLLPLGVGISDHLDLLLDPAHAADAGPALVGTLDAASGWEVLSFEELMPGASALSVPSPAEWRDEIREQCACPVLRLRRPEDGTTAESVPPAKRRKLRMARHRAARRGARIERADGATARAHLEALFRLHAARWESRGEAGALADPRVRGFHATALPGLAAQDLIRSYLVRMDDQVAGVFYGFRNESSVFAYLGGFDPTFAFESPGTLLVGAAIEDAVREGARAFSFLRGQETYKYEWGAIDRINLCRTLRRGAGRL